MLKKRTKISVAITLTSMLFLIFFAFPTVTHAEALYMILSKDSGLGNTVRSIWQQTLNAINLFVIAILIAVAFSQILRINVNTYGVKKVLPSILLATVAANFSMLICRIFVDISNVTMTFFLAGESSTIQSNQDSVTGAFTSVTNGLSLQSASETNSGLFWFCIAQILVIAGAVMVIILAFLFIVRNWLIYFLIPLAPLAFMCTILPQSKTIFTQWWSNFTKWVFMPVVSCFWLWLGGLWFKEASTSTSVILTFGFAAVCYYMAITTPFKMGGEVMKAWGGLGKRIVRPAGDFAKRKAALAWSNQAASENKRNILGHIARANIALNDMNKFDEEKTKDNMDKGLAATMKSKGGRKRTQERAKFGGDIENAQEKVLNEYLKTTEGKAWAKGRAEFITDTNTNKAEKEAGLAEGETAFRREDKGKEYAERLVRAQKNKEMQENLVKEMDKLLVISFNSANGPFKDDKKMIDEYFATLARNKTQDEAITNTANTAVKNVLSDQIFIENIKKELGEIPKKLEELNKQDARMTLLQQNKQAGYVLPGSDDDKELQALEMGQKTRDKQRARLATLPNELQQAAIKFASGKDHLMGFVDEKTGEVKGFAGTIEGGDKTFRDNVGRIMMTRAGKLTTIEIKSDAEKLMDSKTPREIGVELLHGEAGEFGTKELENFRSGNGHLNTPKQNARIEAHILAVSKTARQSNNVYSSISKTALTSMLDDDSAVQAGILFNQIAEERGITDRIDTNKTPDEIRVQINEKMNHKQRAIGNCAYAAVEGQVNVGLSDNPSSYLSGGGGIRITDSSYALNRHDEEPPIDPGEFSSMVRTVAMSRGNYNPNIAENQTIVKNIDQITSVLKAERNVIAERISTTAGIGETNSETFRRTVNDVIAQMPRNEMTSENIAAALNPIIRQFGGKELSAETTLSIPLATGGEKTINLGQAAGRSQAASLAAKSAELISMQPIVQQIKPQISHFSNMQGGRAAVDTALTTLEGTIKDVQSPKVPVDNINRTVNEALRKVGIGTQVDINFPTTEDAIQFLKNTRDAALAVTNAYDQDGNFDMSRAQSAAANHYLEMKSK